MHDNVRDGSVRANRVEPWFANVSTDLHAQERLSAYRGVPNVLGQLGCQIALQFGIQNTGERNLREIGQLQLLIRHDREGVGQDTVSRDEEQDAVARLKITLGQSLSNDLRLPEILGAFVGVLLCACNLLEILGGFFERCPLRAYAGGCRNRLGRRNGCLRASCASQERQRQDSECNARNRA